MNYFGGTQALQVAAGASVDLPIGVNDGVVGKSSALPDGWVTAGTVLNVPAGVYAVTWYLENAGVLAQAWPGSYLELISVALGGGNSVQLYPSVSWPVAPPTIYWTSVSATVPLIEGAGISCRCRRTSASAGGLRSVLSVVRLGDLP